MITDDFAELLVATFNDPDEHSVHLRFNQWWAHAPSEVKDANVEQFLATRSSPRSSTRATTPTPSTSAAR